MSSRNVARYLLAEIPDSAESHTWHSARQATSRMLPRSSSKPVTSVRVPGNDWVSGTQDQSHTVIGTVNSSGGCRNGTVCRTRCVTGGDFGLREIGSGAIIGRDCGVDVNLNEVCHGFLKTSSGTVTTFDPPG